MKYQTWPKRSKQKKIIKLNYLSSTITLDKKRKNHDEITVIILTEWGNKPVGQYKYQSIDHLRLTLSPIAFAALGIRASSLTLHTSKFSERQPGYAVQLTSVFRSSLLLPGIQTMASIWRENMHGHLSADIICSKKRTRSEREVSESVARGELWASRNR